MLAPPNNSWLGAVLGPRAPQDASNASRPRSQMQVASMSPHVSDQFSAPSLVLTADSARSAPSPALQGRNPPGVLRVSYASIAAGKAAGQSSGSSGSAAPPAGPKASSPPKAASNAPSHGSQPVPSQAAGAPAAQTSPAGPSDLSGARPAQRSLQPGVAWASIVAPRGTLPPMSPGGQPGPPQAQPSLLPPMPSNRLQQHAQQAPPRLPPPLQEAVPLQPLMVLSPVHAPPPMPAVGAGGVREAPQPGSLAPPLLTTEAVAAVAEAAAVAAVKTVQTGPSWTRPQTPPPLPQGRAPQSGSAGSPRAPTAEASDSKGPSQLSQAPPDTPSAQGPPVDHPASVFLAPPQLEQPLQGPQPMPPHPPSQHWPEHWPPLQFGSWQAGLEREQGPDASHHQHPPPPPQGLHPMAAGASMAYGPWMSLGPGQRPMQLLPGGHPPFPGSPAPPPHPPLQGTFAAGAKGGTWVLGPPPGIPHSPAMFGWPQPPQVLAPQPWLMNQQGVPVPAFPVPPPPHGALQPPLLPQLPHAPPPPPPPKAFYSLPQTGFWLPPQAHSGGAGSTSAAARPDASPTWPPVAAPCLAPASACEWILAGGLDELQRKWGAAVQAHLTRALRMDDGGVVVSEGIDFGLRAICEEVPAATQPRSQLPQATAQPKSQSQGAPVSGTLGPRGEPIHGSVTSAAASSSSAKAGDGTDSSATTAAADGMVRAVLRVRNTGATCALLLNVRATPQYRHCLRLRDDAGVAVQEPALVLKRKRAAAAATAAAAAVPPNPGSGSPTGAAAAAPAATAAVLLTPGAEYSVEVVLDLSKGAFARRSADRGLLTQLVLFTFVYDYPPAPPEPVHQQHQNQQTDPRFVRGMSSGGWVAAAAAAAGLASYPYSRAAAVATTQRYGVTYAAPALSYATVVGRRVSVAVVDRRHLLEMTSLLKVTAPPFIPAALRQLFSSAPARLHACALSVARALFRTEASSVLSCTAVAASASSLAFRALALVFAELRPHIRGPTFPLAPALWAAACGGGPPYGDSAPAPGSPSATAAVTLAWAQAGGVGRPAVARLEELVRLFQRYARGEGDAGAGGGGGRGFRSRLHLAERMEHVWETEWGKQLGLSGSVPPSLATATRAARPVLEEVFSAAAASATAVAAAAADVEALRALEFQRSEMVRYGKLLLDEEAVMESDIRRFNLYNARIRVALFNDSMTCYRVLNWPPAPEAPAQAAAATQQSRKQPPPAAASTAVAAARQPSPSASGTSASGSGAASGRPAQEEGEGADVAPAAERPYRGPRLQQLCTVVQQADEAEEESGAGLRAGVRAKGTKKKTPGTQRLMAGVVEVPGLVEGRPQLVAGDGVYVRLEGRRDTEYAAQLLAVDGGQVILVMPAEYWKDLRAMAIAPTSSTATSSTAASACTATNSSPPHSGAATMTASGTAASAAARPAPLAHCCFTFDRTPFGRMHDALLRAAVREDILLPRPPPPPPLPPTPPEPYDTRGLPDLPDDLYQPLPLQPPHPSTSAVLPAAAPQPNARGVVPINGDTATKSTVANDGGIGAAMPCGADAELATLATGLRLVGGTPLNPEQRLACAAMLHGAGRELPFVLFGPPGTGKTVTLVECALQILAAAGIGPSTGGGAGARDGVVRPQPVRLLLTAPQNYSADLIASSLAAALGPAAGKKRVLRVNDPRRRIVEAKADVLPYCLVEESSGTFRLPVPGELRAAQVVVCSCSSAGLLREGTHMRSAATASGWTPANGSSGGSGGGGGSGGTGGGSSAGGDTRVDFTHVMIDEAGQALLPEALIPLTLRAAGGAAMLCGDPRQLEPVVRSMSAARAGLSTSLLELLMDAAEREGHLRRAREAAVAAHRLLDPEQQQQVAQVQWVQGAQQAGKGSEGNTGPAGGPLRGVMLVRNYRSAAPLLDLPSRLFYDKQLQACVDGESSRAPQWDLLMRPTYAGAVYAAAATTIATSAAKAAPAVAVTATAHSAAAVEPPAEAEANGTPAARPKPTAAIAPVTASRGLGQGPQGVQAGRPEAGKRAAVAVAEAAGSTGSVGRQPDNGSATSEGVVRKEVRQLAGAVSQGAAEGSPDAEDRAAEEVPVVAPAHMMFFGVRGQQCQDLDAPSFFNPLEASTVADLVESLIRASWAAATQRLEAQRQRGIAAAGTGANAVAGGGAPAGGGGGEGRQGADALSGVVSQNHIGIICTYRKQVFKLRQLLRDRGLGGVRVGTVDDYQGQEERIVFISTVLSRVESLPWAAQLAAPHASAPAGAASAAADGDGSHPFGLWSHPRRFNVAVTRSRALLVVVGHPAVLLADRYWRELVRQCVARGTYRGAGEAQVRNRMRQDTGAACTTGPSRKSAAAGAAVGCLHLPAGTATRVVRPGGEEPLASGREGSTADDVTGPGPDVPENGVGGEADVGKGGIDQESEYDNDLYDDEYRLYDGDDDELQSGDEGALPDAAEMAALVQQLAEATTLGLGCEDEIYPDPGDLNAYYENQAAYFEEMPFRVQL